MYQPDMSGRDFDRKIKGLEREQDVSRHSRGVGRGPRRWLWALGIFVALIVVGFVVYQLAVPSDPVLP